MLKLIGQELKNHAPFTLLGAASGIAIAAFLYRIPKEVSYFAFYVLHPGHVLLSAMVTASMYQLHTCAANRHQCNRIALVLVGYFGSIGIATLSDSVIPYIGERWLALPHTHLHIGFLEAWWLVNPLALLGIAIAYRWPQTKVPHAGHVLLSTGASLFHMLMALESGLTWSIAFALTIFLFIAVWLPCCLSDIAFPILFVGKSNPDNQHFPHSHHH
ncbi:MAG: hypothetical protein COV74_04310 [Candidatus Omnitrophica bacterium CG11_big_fil_rev_8_21_14_0_20_45_26]|uniref:Uncharacterized protein n=1 Tax=Candidatus Abzuiibacterium crystallinum TaxID=1974748 RepID=A0A2H0LQF3_9BACT|nr:MAG: hypothetical protein COV74_04310 [Candidatus Omnitrophica bacterium CG11_big_fil_rev_8_21_14_0_20_45_26]PIW63965.1 MAG: hypothetical protein COW12_08670 [Candidatus Omnitrophica bacterium CG12_big_fil_rev_8_21_14_0_65_45_16]